MTTEKLSGAIGFLDDDIIEELRIVDIGNMTPLDALNKLYELQNKVKNRW